MRFMVGDRVCRQSDNLVQTVYDIDSINRRLHVNWLNERKDLRTESHFVPEKGLSPVVLIKDPLRKR